MSETTIDPAMVLTWLAVKGMVTGQDVERRWGSAPEAADVMAKLTADGDVEQQDEYFLLSDTGDERLSTMCRGALSSEQQQEFDTFLGRFEPIDLEMKRVATQWQLATAGAGDDYDDAMLAALEALLGVDTRLGDAVAGLSSEVAVVLAPYVAALEEARDSLLSGTRSAFTGTEDTTYHSVWFVMHEVILRTAGQSR
jgi:hypothetical protein